MASSPVKSMTMLRAVLLGGVLFALVLALLGCGSSHSTVPSQVREAIVKGFPGMAFIPGRLPSGYHYESWNNCRNRSCYSMGFLHGSPKNKDYLNLSVKRGSCPAPPKWPAKDTHTLRVDGHALKWSKTDTVGPVVWRCLTKQGRSFVIFSEGGATQKLAELVGSAVPVH